MSHRPFSPAEDNLLIACTILGRTCKQIVDNFAIRGFKRTELSLSFRRNRLARVDRRMQLAIYARDTEAPIVGEMRFRERMRKIGMYARPAKRDYSPMTRQSYYTNPNAGLSSSNNVTWPAHDPLVRS